MSVDGCAAIVAAGAGLTGKEAEALPQKVWEAGVLEVSITLNNYLVALYKPRGSESGKIQERKE
ncbi:hypothetical protein D3C84_865950 [compost metagenome]